MVDREKKKPLWEVFSKLTDMVRQDHLAKRISGGHDFTHALMVAQYGKIITETEHIGILAWIAGIIHNTDLLFPEEKVEKQLKYYLDQGTSFSNEEKTLILEAVVNHSKLNDPKDNPVTITLKDADRLANIGPNVFIRSGQFYHQLPTYNPRYLLKPDPTATYKNPKTSLHNIRCGLEWESWLRLPRAKELAKPWFKLLRAFIEGFAKQLDEVGLLPYPFPED